MLSVIRHFATHCLCVLDEDYSRRYLGSLQVRGREGGREGEGNRGEEREKMPACVRYIHMSLTHLLYKGYGIFQ